MYKIYTQIIYIYITYKIKAMNKTLPSAVFALFIIYLLTYLILILIDIEKSINRAFSVIKTWSK